MLPLEVQADLSSSGGQASEPRTSCHVVASSTLGRKDIASPGAVTDHRGAQAREPTASPKCSHLVK